MKTKTKRSKMRRKRSKGRSSTGLAKWILQSDILVLVFSFILVQGLRYMDPRNKVENCGVKVKRKGQKEINIHNGVKERKPGFTCRGACRQKAFFFFFKAITV